MNVCTIIRSYSSCDCCEAEKEVVAVAATAEDAEALIITLEADRIESAIKNLQVYFKGEMFNRLTQDKVDILTGKNTHSYAVEVFEVQTVTAK